MHPTHAYKGAAFEFIMMDKVFTRR